MTQQPPAWTAGHAPPPRFGTAPPQPWPAGHWPAATGRVPVVPVHPSWQPVQPGFGPPPGPSVADLWAAPPPPPQPPRRARWVVPLVVFALFAGGGFLRTIGSGQPVWPGGPSVRTASPSAVPSVAKATPTTAKGRILIDNALYPLRLSGDCPGQVSPKTRREYLAQVDALLECLSAAYRPLIERAGYDFRPVEHTYFDKTTDSPCGRDEDAYAFYCEENSKIYFSERVYSYASSQRLSVAEVVIHEYNHHVQSMVGILNAEDRRRDPAAERRVELQSLCWTYYTFNSVRGFAVNDDDLFWFDQIWADSPDPDGHGSVAAQRLWGSRGLSGTDLAACNTWAAADDEVR